MPNKPTRIKHYASKGIHGIFIVNGFTRSSQTPSVSYLPKSSTSLLSAAVLFGGYERHHKS